MRVLFPREDSSLVRHPLMHRPVETARVIGKSCDLNLGAIGTHANWRK